MQMKGIDVSSYQGDIDFKQVKNSGIDFVIIKAGEWDHTVDKFEENYVAAKAAGLHVGFYWFCDGITLDEIEQEADACIKALEGKQFDFPIYMDLENQEQYDLGKEFCSDAVRLFCGKLEKAGYYTGLYTSTSTLNDLITDDIKKKYTIWVADWRGYCGYEGDYGMWQYGAGYVPGINGMTDMNIIEFGTDTDYPGNYVEDGVDLDYAYEDFPSLIIPNGLNNYPKPNDKWDNDDCKEIANILSINGAETALSGDNWFLIDKSCSFTLETLPYAKVKIYVVGGGFNGAEWDINGGALGSQGGSVFVKEIMIMGNVSCQAFVADIGKPTSTSIKIEKDIYKCDDDGSVWRKPTSSGSIKVSDNSITNAENGANGVKTPYGYVGSSGGGGGTYIRGIPVYAGKGGIGAGDGGEVGQDGTNAVNYGCGGGSAGFEGKAGRGRGGCIIFEILDSGECDSSPNKPNNGDAGCGCNIDCNKLANIFICPETPDSNSSCSKETTYRLSYDGEEPIEVETVTTTPCTEIFDVIERTPSNSTFSTTSNRSCGCNSSRFLNSQSLNTNSNGKCECGSSKSGSGGCVSYDIARWGENWLLFYHSGEYTLNFETDVKITLYLVGGGENGKDGLYYNKTAYGGDGGAGGYVNIVSDIEVVAGECNIDVIIGNEGEYGSTSAIIGKNEYCCNGLGWTGTDHGIKGVCGKFTYQNASNGANGIETPFGWVGSSGGGGAAYYNGNETNRGRGGVSAGNGGKIVDGKSTKGDKGIGFGCGGGGGAASPTGWCKGGKGKQGCVIITW